MHLKVKTFVTIKKGLIKTCLLRQGAFSNKKCKKSDKSVNCRNRHDLTVAGNLAELKEPSDTKRGNSIKRAVLRCNFVPFSRQNGRAALRARALAESRIIVIRAPAAGHFVPGATRKKARRLSSETEIPAAI